MALVKLTVVIGAGFIGTVLTRDGNLPDVTRLFSGAFRIVTKHLRQDKDNHQSTDKTQKDFLLAQVNTLREELQLLASSRPITIVTGAGSGSGKYRLTAVIIVGTLGYVYIWWKGWKISDMMFVTRRGFSDACNQVGKKLDLVSSSVRVAKQQLSSRIDQVDSNLDECRELATATRSDVSHLHVDVSAIYTEVESVHRAVQTLETKIGQIEGTQDYTTRGIYHLCQFVEKTEQGGKKEHILKREVIQGSPSSSQHAIELPQTSPIVSRTLSLPPLSVESASSSHSSSVVSPSVISPSAVPPSSSTSPATAHASPRVLRSSIALSAFGLKEISHPTKLGNLKSNMILRSTPNGTAEPNYNVSRPRYAASTGTAEPYSGTTESENSTAPNSAWSTWKLPRIGILSRSRSTAT